jgi:hypothetical protein
MKGFSLEIIEEIQKLIGIQFDEFTLKFLGILPQLNKQKKIVFSTSRNSVTSLFLQALGNRKPEQKEEEVLKVLVKVSHSYIDALKARTQANVSQQVMAYSQKQMLDNKDISFKKIDKIVKDEMNKQGMNLSLIANAETNKAINTGTALQIEKVAESNGIKRPVVFFIPVIDERNDPETYRLHLLPDRLTPRLYYLDELGTEYHKKGDKWPKLQGTNPNCRCKLTYLAPGMGFNDHGKIAWKGFGHDELKLQREKYGLPSELSPAKIKTSKRVKA